MATLIDVGILEPFGVIFPMIFVWALVFAFLQKTEFFKKSIAIDAVIAFAISFMVLLSKTVVDILNFIIPWFTVAIIFFVLLLLIFMVFGAKESDILAYVKNDKGVGWVIIGISLIIIFAGFGNVLGQDLLVQGGSVPVEGTISDGSTVTGNFQNNAVAIFTHPKVLGLVVLFAIAVFAIGLLSGAAGQ
tara:strand:- start:3262 stop:3828 length:567 start_codon:yes stop_codon:yes gene_type:complete